MRQTSTDLEPECVFRDGRRRIALVFTLNVVLSLTMALILIGAITTGIVLGFLGYDVWAAAVGGAAFLDLIGAAVYKPLDQIGRVLVKLQQADILILSVQERLRVASEILASSDRMTAVTNIWANIVAEFNALPKDRL